MAVKPETTYTNKLKKLLPKPIYVMKNNNPYLGGVPDLWISSTKGDLWVEMKYLPKLPKSVPIRVPELLSSLQMQWLNDRRKEGRNVAVIIGCPSGGVLLRDYEWQNELTSSVYSTLIKSNAELATWIKEQVSE